MAPAFRVANASFLNSGLLDDQEQTMNNGIMERQNAPENMKFLAAQRTFYTKAKFIAGSQACIACFTPLIGAVIVGVRPAFDEWAALLGIFATLLDTAWLDPKQTDFRRCGANTQEQFDSAVLQTTCNVVLRGPCSPEEDIFEASLSNSKANARLSNWYPQAASEVPLPVGRLICQRTNVWWDAKLRKRYRAWILTAVVIFSLSIVGYGLDQQLTLRKIVLDAALLLPLFQWAIRESKRQKDGAADLDRLRSYAEDLWERVLESSIVESELNLKSNELQTAILIGRRERPVVFDWAYRLLRRKQEEQMNENATVMATSYHQKVGT